MNLRTIQAAINGGATLTVKPSPLPGKPYCTARLNWPDGDKLEGDLALSVSSALEDLERRAKFQAEDQPEETK